jgi:hypothetical protein
LKHTCSEPLAKGPLALQLMKWGLCARTVVAMKPRAIMVQVKILNFFILLLIIISIDFCLVFYRWFFVSQPTNWTQSYRIQPALNIGARPSFLGRWIPKKERVFS